MSKTVYINKSVLKSSATISAYGGSGKNYLSEIREGEVEYTNMTQSCLAFPCIETTYVDTPITFSNATSIRGTNVTDIGISIVVQSIINGSLFTNSAFYKNREKFSLVFSFISSYKTVYNNAVYTYTDSSSPKIKVTIPANAFEPGKEKIHPINDPSLFDNIVGEMHSSGISGAPNNDIWYILESISLDSTLIAVEAKNAGDLTLEVATQIIVDMKKFLSIPKLVCTQSKPNWSVNNMWQKEFTLPETTKAGAKLFLKDINFEYPKQLALYTHTASIDTGAEYRFLYQAPISSRSHSVSKELNFKYYSASSPANVISDFTDGLESSTGADYTAIAPYYEPGYREVLITDTGLPYRSYVHQSFYDSCIFEFSLPDGSIKSISLWDLFKQGLTLPAGITSVKLSGLYLPNIEGFMLNNYIVEDTALVNNLEPRHFYSAISAFSKINLNINIGYQSASSGIYIDTAKVRRLYIDEAEVESFIADE